MGARRDLGHDAAEGGMLAHLAQHEIGKDARRTVIATFDHGGSGLVAARFDAKYTHSGALLARRRAANKLGQPTFMPLTSGSQPLQSTDSSIGAVRIGTRGSPLALTQAEETRRILAASLDWTPERIVIVPIRTTGDRISDRPLAEAGGKGLFTKEIDEALLSGRIDIGVHSAKDLATAMPPGIEIAACLPREDVRDAFVSPHAATLADLPQGAKLGTSSLRRKALALRMRPDLTVVNLRGNVDTRLKKIVDGVADATLLAAAGLNRLKLSDRAASYLDTAVWLPAPGQGAIAITARSGDRLMRDRLAAIDDRATTLALACERAFLAVLDGSCRTPIAGLARIEGERLSFEGMIVKPDGSAAHMATRGGAASEAASLGADAGDDLARRGGPDFFVAA
jgi:hydroxymethylbilane synthase